MECSRKFCQYCGHRFLPTGRNQKYCPRCCCVLELQRAYVNKTRTKTNILHVKMEMETKIAREREKANRYNFRNCIALNESFPECEGHHIDKDHVVYIPRKMHESVNHCLETGKNMSIINALALEYLQKTLEHSVSKKEAISEG